MTLQPVSKPSIHLHGADNDDGVVQPGSQEFNALLAELKFLIFEHVKKMMESSGRAAENVSDIAVAQRVRKIEEDLKALLESQKLKGILGKLGILGKIIGAILVCLAVFAFVSNPSPLSGAFLMVAITTFLDSIVAGATDSEGFLQKAAKAVAKVLESMGLSSEAAGILGMLIIILVLALVGGGAGGVARSAAKAAGWASSAASRTGSLSSLMTREGLKNFIKTIRNLSPKSVEKLLGFITVILQCIQQGLTIEATLAEMKVARQELFKNLSQEEAEFINKILDELEALFHEQTQDTDRLRSEFAL